jgi:hypothetical protein
MDAPVLIGLLLFAWTMWAVLFWGSIAILERHNPFNTFGWALTWSAVEIVASVGMSAAGFAGYGILIAWLVFLFRLLLGRYELGVLHAIGVVIVTVVGPYFVSGAFFSWVGSSETLLLVALYGLPIGVLVVWRWPRPAPEQPTNLPRARLARLWRKEARPAPAPAPTKTPGSAVPAAAPLAAAPLAAAPPAAAPPALPAPPAPPAAPPRLVSPPAAPSPRADGEPSFLR